MTNDEVIAIVSKAFKEAPRPDFFAYHKTDCDDCRTADLIMDSRTVDTLTLEDLDLEHTGALSSTNLQGFRYYFPALVRLCLEQSDYLLLNSIFYRLLPKSHFTEASSKQKRVRDKKNKRVNSTESPDYSSMLSQPEKEATLTFLNHLEKLRKDLQIKSYRKEEIRDQIGLLKRGPELETALEIWENIVTTGLE